MPGLIKQLPHHKPWMVAIGAIAAVVVLGVCGFGSYLLLRDDTTVVGANPTADATVIKRDLTDRRTDPNPLTAADVFPTAEIVVDPKIPPYKRIGDAQVAEDCRVAATGDVGKLLVDSGCTQVVRATFSSPDGAYFVTGGIFNLADAATASQASTKAKDMVDGGTGRFTGYISVPDTNKVLGRAPTNLAWEVRGHFLVYSVICRVDGAKIESDDPNLKVIVYDIMQKYLRDHVIGDWSIQKPAASPGAASPGP